MTYRMSPASEVRDNSTMESFLNSLKTKQTARRVYRSREQVRLDAFGYIEQLKLKSKSFDSRALSPIGFEIALKAQLSVY